MSNIKRSLQLLSKKHHKIVSGDDLKILLSPLFGEKTGHQTFYKLTHQLKNNGYLLTIRKDLYYIKHPDEQTDESALLGCFFWDLMINQAKQSHQSKRYLGGLKALELHLGNTDPESIIHIYNNTKNSIERIMFQQDIIHKHYQLKDISFSRFMSLYSVPYTLGKKSLRISCLELALLETLYNTPTEKLGYCHELISKILKKHKKTLRITVREQILRTQKYHTSINKLYDIARTIDPSRAGEILKVIKKVSYVL